MMFAKDKRLLMACEIALDEVEVKSFDINTLTIHFHRLNNRFKESFEFALLLLSKSIPLFANDKKNFAFLFDMNKLFESFAGKMIQELKPETQLQNQKSFGDLNLKPDIIVNDWTIDTKYKILHSKEKMATNDKYQMFVYGKNYKKKNTMLLYPKHFKHLEHFDYELDLGDKGDEVLMKIKSLDLACGSCGYGEYIDEIKNRIKEIVK